VQGEKRITVFTPTYNRAYILSRLYNSLKKQTNKYFIWLVIDDGSKDNTEELIRSWISEKFIEIYYYKQNNGGKQRAHNKAVEICDTELFICVDSDDYLTEHAIEIFITTWDSIKNKQGISGIVALRGKNSRTPLGTWMPKKVQKSTLNDLYFKYNFKGDTVLLFRTDVLKKFPFFLAEGEDFIGEGFIYLQIDQQYSMCLLDKILYICEYLKDGYSANIRNVIKNNPIGYTVLKKQAALLSKTLLGKYLNTISYLIGCILSKENNPIINAPNKWIAIISYLPAYIFYRFKYR